MHLADDVVHPLEKQRAADGGGVRSRREVRAIEAQHLVRVRVRVRP